MRLLEISHRIERNAIGDKRIDGNYLNKFFYIDRITYEFFISSGIRKLERSHKEINF